LPEHEEGSRNEDGRKVLRREGGQSVGFWSKLRRGPSGPLYERNVPSTLCAGNGKQNRRMEGGGDVRIIQREEKREGH